jgi:CDP-diacylglycerol--glycerol-3-phosphate 3-phosphatidyltransferase
MRFVVLRYGVMAAGRGGKVKTVLQSVAITLYLLPLPGWAHAIAVVVMFAALVMTAHRPRLCPGRGPIAPGGAPVGR